MYTDSYLLATDAKAVSVTVFYDSNGDPGYGPVTATRLAADPV